MQTLAGQVNFNKGTILALVEALVLVKFAAIAFSRAHSNCNHVFVLFIEYGINSRCVRELLIFQIFHREPEWIETVSTIVHCTGTFDAKFFEQITRGSIALPSFRDELIKERTRRCFFVVVQKRIIIPGIVVCDFGIVVRDFGIVVRDFGIFVCGYEIFVVR